MADKVGILTAGSDCPGLNASIRGFGKAARNTYGMALVGFRDGFRGLVENRTLDLSGDALSNILTAGGTILGTSRDIPQAMAKEGKTLDLTEDAVKAYHANKLDALVCIGGRETQEAATRLKQAGLNVLTLPKSADNDVPMTDTTIGFDTAKDIATEAIDRLHSTANSNHRIIIVEIMGREVGWLTLGAGIAAGADVILIPEIPYNIDKISQAILQRNQAGKMFSIVAVAEGATSSELVAFFERSIKIDQKKHASSAEEDMAQKMEASSANMAARRFCWRTVWKNRPGWKAGSRSWVTCCGAALLRQVTGCWRHNWVPVQLIWSMKDSLASWLGYRHGGADCVPLEDVAGYQKKVPLDHSWIKSARHVGTIMGD